MRTLLFIFGILLGLLAVGYDAFAQQPSIMVEVQAKVPFTADAATGLLMSSGKTKRVDQASVRLEPNGYTVVSFTVSPNDALEGAFASAMLSNAQGEVAFADVRTVSAQGSGLSFARLPECAESISTKAFQYNQLGLLQSLVNVRTNRRNVEQQKIEKLMQGKFLERLRKLERGFGLGDASDLRADIRSDELVARLARLQYAVQAYEDSH